MRRPKKPLKIWEKKAQELEKLDQEQMQELAISDDLQTNVEILDGIFQDCADIGGRDFVIPGEHPTPAHLFMLRGMLDKSVVNDSIIAPLTSTKTQRLDSIPEIISGHSVDTLETIDAVANQVLRGNCVVLAHGHSQGWAVDTREPNLRSIEESSSQPVIRGPRESLIEDLENNIAMVRRRLKTPKLKVVERNLGRMSHTTMAVLYIDGIGDPKVLDEVYSRLDKIDIDAVMDTGQLEQLIEDNTISPFPQIASTERPDNIAASLLEGRVSIMVDGSSWALILPTVLTDYLQSSEDYYDRFYFSTAIRALRYFLFAVALLGPALYIAISTFHHELIPTQLLSTLISARAGIPFPTVVEAGLMEAAFEALREAGLRLPKPVGQAVSIVGALIIGQAAVEAGIVSPIMVIVVAGTGIASFSIPGFNVGAAVRILRFPFMLLAATLGLYGVNLGLSLLLIHLVSLRSFGVPFMSPIAPMTVYDWKDLILRVPTWAMYQRPTFIAKGNVQRQRPGSRSFQPPVEDKDE